MKGNSIEAGDARGEGKKNRQTKTRKREEGEQHRTPWRGRDT